MRPRWLGLVLAMTVACSGAPTGGGDPPPSPTGTILVATPNGTESGTYLVDVGSGSLRKLASYRDPLTVALQGGYSIPGQFVYGTNGTTPRRIMRLPLDGGPADTLLAIPAGHSIGAYHLSPDGRTMAVQTEAAAGIQLWTVDLLTVTWTQHADQVGGIDAIPLADIRWSSDERFLVALTELFPDRSELVRIDLATNRFDIISPSTPITIVPSLDVSPDGQVIAHGDGAATITFRNPDGTLAAGFPDIPGRAARPTFSPDGKFLAYQQHAPAPNFGITIMIMRLSDGARWPLEIDADFEVWLSDWI